MAAVSIVRITSRTVCAFAWFADSLAQQIGDDDVEVIAVDEMYSPERSAQFDASVRGRFSFRHVQPKPTPYRGPSRVTRDQYFAAASARNTGIVYARGPYIVFVDDAGVLMPGWWSAAREAAESGLAVSGAYHKQWGMIVKDGRLTSGMSGQPIDQRWERGREDAPVRIEGGQFYSSNIAAPRQLLLDFNGFDELCDACGGEDYQLGLRLERAGVPLFYHRSMLTVESEELHRIGQRRLIYDPVLDEASYLSRLSQFSVSQRAARNGFDATSMIVDIACGAPSCEAFGNYYSLRELDAATMPSVAQYFPTHHWFDGRPLAEISPTRRGD